MRRYTGGLFYLIGGALAGTLSAYAMVEHTGIQMLGTNSPWQSRIAALEGATGIYVASSYLLAGRLPLAPGQLVEASAEADNDGEMLTASCTYEITSTGPLPRWWSVAVLNPGGSATSDQAALDSGMTVYEPDGSVHITAAAIPVPGNWLKVEASRRFTLLYAALPGSGRAAMIAPPFAITRKGC